MATLEQLKTALVNAHNAGDTTAAQVLAKEILKQQGGAPSVPETAPSAPEPIIGARATDPNMPAPNAEYWGMGNQAADFLTGGLMNKGGAAMNGVLDALVGAAKGDGWNYSDNYNKWLDWNRENQRLYNEQNPVRSSIGTGAGVLLGITSMPMVGRGLLGAAETGALYGGIGGAAQDADTLSERAGNTLLGGLTGSLIGGAGYGGGKLAGMGLNKAADVISVMRAPPEVKAASEFFKAADDQFGPYNAMAMSKALNDLGPDAINADVLGKRGYAMGRGAANISPEARQTLEDVAAARKEGQNSRLATDVEKASGLPAGNTKNVEILKAEDYAKRRPEINKAYQAARAAGQDVPFQIFDNVITTPVGRKAFNQALENVTSRAARDPSAGGNLAVLDETKRILDGWATQAFRNSDPMAQVYAETAKSLRGRLDNFLSTGGEYSKARALRQQAYKADEAFDLGAQLGGNRIPLGLPESVNKVAPNQRRYVARAYGATKVENLLNKKSTEGAYNDLITPQGKKAARAAVGTKQAANLEKALDREKLYNVTNREIVGNSSTARQLIEAGGVGLGTTAMGTLLGYDPTTSTVAGIAAGLGKKMAPTIARRLVTESQKQAAPFIAKMLADNGLPTTQAIPVSQLSSLIQKYLTAGDAKMAKTLALFWNNEIQNTNRQMKAEN